MIKFENTEVVGWEAAIRGMRNPLESWERSDSGRCSNIMSEKTLLCYTCKEDRNDCKKHLNDREIIIGPNDLTLMKKLRNAGTDHRKFMRMITVYVDITAPLYWWKEFDTYKVGTVANSCSAMHCIHKKEFTLEDFSCEHLIGEYDVCDICSDDFDGPYNPKDLMDLLIEMLNEARYLFLKTKAKKYWWQMIQLLPSSYNQTRNVMLNYEVLYNMYHARKNHKLDEWREFCKWIETLEFSFLITGEK